MVRNWPGIRVENVRASSQWYQTLLGCKSPMSAESPHRELFDQVVDADGTVLLCLVSWKGHDDPWSDEAGGTGKGLSLYFVVDDFDDAWKRAQSLDARVELEPELGERGYQTREFEVLDPDGYRVSVGDATKGYLAQARA